MHPLTIELLTIEHQFGCQSYILKIVGLLTGNITITARVSLTLHLIMAATHKASCPTNGATVCVRPVKRNGHLECVSLLRQ